MNELRELAIVAHGGLERWHQLTSATTHILTSGVLWTIKGQDDVISDSIVHVDLHRQFTSHTPFGGPGLRDRYTPQRVTIEDESGEVLAERLDPRKDFDGHSLETPWDRLHLAYFSGYAMWTYLTQPFSWAESGVKVQELDPWEENGETWRRLQVDFPKRIATHSSRNVYYLDAQGLIRRHDYITEVLGSVTPAAHYGYDHRDFDGIMVPTKRRVYLVGEDGAVMPEPLVVSIDLDNVHFR